MEETVELIPISFEKVRQSRSYTCIVLGNEQKKFAIYSDPAIGKIMQMHLTNTEKSRPYTHDLLNKIFRGFEIKVKHIVLYELHDTIFHARLFLEQQIGDVLNIVEIDARPSDCIPLALMQRTPIYCTRTVLENAISFEE